MDLSKRPEAWDADSIPKKRTKAATQSEIDAFRPLCACGCGELLIIPTSFLKNAASLSTYQKYWKQYPYKRHHRLKPTPYQAKLEQLESMRPLCACGCGERLDIPTIAEHLSVTYIQKYWQKHPTKQNHRIVQSIPERIAELEASRPLCACGCGKLLDIPTHFFTRSHPVNAQTVQKHWQKHPYRQGHGIWNTRTESYLEAFETLDAECLGLIYGTLLGDSSITYPNSHSRFPRLTFIHSEQQKEWLEHKAQRLAQLHPTTWSAPNMGYSSGKTAFYCRTACHPQLREVCAVVKPEPSGKKTVTQDWLNQVTSEGLAWWYMDDGSLSITRTNSPSIRLHTQGFSIEENQLLVAWLNDWGYAAKLHYARKAEKRYPYIYMGARATRQWLSDLKAFSIPAMAYKFRAN